MSKASKRTLRKLSQAALFSAVRGAAAAAGTGVVTIIVWWICHH